MDIRRLFLFLLVFYVLPIGHGQKLPASSSSQPLLTKTPLTAEQNEIYGKFLDFRLSLNKGVINLSDRTFPINLSGPDLIPCLEGIEASNLGEARETVHLISEDILKGRAVRLVNPNRNDIKEGLLSLSEIVFDKRHQFAVMSFTFSCSAPCGQGGPRTVVEAGTIVFEKRDNEWRQSKRYCPTWFS
jgi:hypothetical protein